MDLRSDFINEVKGIIEQMIEKAGRNSGKSLFLTFFVTLHGMKDLYSIKKILTDLKPELERNFHVSSIGIFGSVARNDFSANSDLDLIVDFNQPVGITFIDLAKFLEEKVQEQIDLVSRKGIRPQYLSSIEKEIVYV
jgi:predicted nucleotidyltransferase